MRFRRLVRHLGSAIGRVSREQGAEMSPPCPWRASTSALQKCARELGHPPTMREYNAWRECCS